jgi:hypothetical protein
MVIWKWVNWSPTTITMDGDLRAKRNMIIRSFCFIHFFQVTPHCNIRSSIAWQQTKSFWSTNMINIGLKFTAVSLRVNYYKLKDRAKQLFYGVQQLMSHIMGFGHLADGFCKFRHRKHCSTKETHSKVVTAAQARLISLQSSHYFPA